MAELPQIVRQRMKQQVEAHPDADLLTGFAENSLTRREREQVMTHLSACASCREVVSLTTAGQKTEAEIAVAPARSGWMRWPMLRWAAVGSAATVVLAAVLLSYQSAVVRPRQVPSQAREDSQFPAAVPRANEQPAAQAEKAAGAKELDRKRQLPEAQRPAKPAGIPSEPRDDFREPPLQKGPQIAAHGPAGRQTQADLAQRPLASTAASPASAKSDEKVVARDAVNLPAEESRSRAASDKREASPEAARLDAQTKDQAANTTLPLAGKPAELKKPFPPQSVPESELKAKTGVAGGIVTGGPVRRPAFAMTKDAALPRWSLTAAGELRRSTDAGRTWETVKVEGASFRAISVVRGDIWAGGSGGLLYHSGDSGQQWTRVTPVADGEQLRDDIVRIEFIDGQQGTIITARRESWSTKDGGRSWSRH